MTDQELKDKVVSILNEQAMKDARVRGAWTNAEPSLEIVERCSVTRFDVEVEARTREYRLSDGTATKKSACWASSMPWSINAWEYLNDDWSDDSWREAGDFWEECPVCHNKPGATCTHCNGRGYDECFRCKGRGVID